MHIVEDNSQFGGSPNTMMNELSIGDNFAMCTEEGNPEGAHYYILQCQQAKFVVTSPFTCVWDNDFHTRDHAVEGIYYQRWEERRTNSYVYLSGSHPAYIHSHLVHAIDFPMLINDHRIQGSDPTYKVLLEHHELIMASISGTGES
jgi:hypothetical protein